MEKVCVIGIFNGIDPDDNSMLVTYKLVFTDGEWVYETAFYDENGGMGWLPASQFLSNRFSELLTEKFTDESHNKFNYIVNKIKNGATYELVI